MWLVAIGEDIVSVGGCVVGVDLADLPLRKVAGILEAAEGSGVIARSRAWYVRGYGVIPSSHTVI